MGGVWTWSRRLCPLQSSAAPEPHPVCNHLAPCPSLSARPAHHPQAVYVHTARNVLIQVSPHTRLPRTFKRFSGLMVQLLHKLSIRATNGPDKLMRVGGGPAAWARAPRKRQAGGCRAACVRCGVNAGHGSCGGAQGRCYAESTTLACTPSRQVVKGPVTRYLPPGCPRIGFSHSAAQLVPLHEWVATHLDEDQGPPVFVVGAFAHGKIDAGYVDNEVRACGPLV